MAQGVSEYVKGFSFMPENKVDVIDLQYIEGGELSRAWKISRRERLKNIEAKIWDEFINERDVVKSVKSENPYQFLEEVPEGCIREVLDTELTKMKQAMAEEVLANPSEPSEEQSYKENLQDPRDTMVTFAESLEDEQSGMIFILDDEDGSEAGERDEVNESMGSVCTVRENETGAEATPKLPENMPADLEKSPENVTSMIETSIYSAKVKELQSKVNLELLSVITTLENHNVHQLDRNSLFKLQRQCSEFCARFGRIYMYPLSRQVQDVTRHNNAATPYARHTHTRSQLIRAVSLQQNMLNSLQMFHKWFTQKTPLRECVASLKSFIQLMRDGDLVCPVEVHNEELMQTCESLEKALGLYSEKLDNFLGQGEQDKGAKSPASRSVKSGKAAKKRADGTSKRQRKTNGQAEAKLSMYSLDRFPRSKGPVSVSRISGATSKARLGDAFNVGAKNPNTLENSNATTTKKSARSRRPLMRAPGNGQRRTQMQHDNIATLVEGVDIMATPQLSALNSARDELPPRTSPRCPRSPHARQRSPRGFKATQTPTTSPERKKDIERELKLALHAAQVSDEALPSVITVQCARKGSPARKSPCETTPRLETDGKETKDDKNATCTNDVSVLLRQLCAGQSNTKIRSQKERISGSKNAQLLCINGDSPRSPSLGTPQLLRILEETIQKQAPKPQFYTKPPVKDLDRYRLSFSRTSSAADALFQYRTKFVQHMLSSPMYANSRIGKPWETIGKISEEIIDEILLSCAKEMQLEHIVEELYKTETQ